MTSRRREGPARTLQPGFGLGRILLLGFWILLLGAAIASMVGWLPNWVSLAALALAMTYNVIVRIPELMSGFRDFRAEIPRVDPDYRRRR